MTIDSEEDRIIAKTKGCVSIAGLFANINFPSSPAESFERQLFQLPETLHTAIGSIATQ
ncbi:hypothetical protein PAXRUDRAFT_832525 [Paxillus rubicundulus Ve08.2h10]|uniref:Uncharacterized protein n=1 Tax=Paxillus rubicundulus Ve08.2h10 TaxID=930991 RepID=A0A0D0DCN1_9AGAM|nr:hypothetical protein PAXRUDRAFT_832525 [Paxillus rubicundulus Ve08.2h10]